MFSFFHSPHCKTVLNKPVCVLLPVLSPESEKSHPYRGVLKQSWSLWRLRAALLAYYLITISCKTAALHSTGVEIPLVVKLEDRQPAVDVVEHRGKAPTQCQQLGAITVEPDAHGTLKGEVSTIAEQGTGKRQVGASEMGCTYQLNYLKTELSLILLRHFKQTSPVNYNLI